MNLEQTIKLLIVEDYDALSLGIISHLKRQSQGIDYKVTQINNLTEALLEARMRCFMLFYSIFIWTILLEGEIYF